MILEFSNDLSKLYVFAQGRELASIFGYDRDEQGKRVYAWPESRSVLIHTFSNPILVTDNYKISQLNPTLRDSLFTLFQSSQRTTSFQSTQIHFDAKKYVGVWGPSIDTLFLCKSLHKIDLKNVYAACEVGAGSGFVAKFLLEHISLSNIDLIDINEYAKRCWQDNIDDDRASFYIQDAKQVLEQKKYDLVVCNPPYIPRPKSIDDNPYEGLSLLVYILKQASHFLTQQGKLIVNVSHLSMETLHSVAKENNLTISELDRMRVPLKVFNILNNVDWLEYLKEKGLVQRLDQGYEYWQDIIVVEITRQ